VDATLDGPSNAPATPSSYAPRAGANVWLSIGLREGKNREVRKILSTLGLEVNRLIRVSFGPFQLLDLEAGDTESVRRRVLADQLGPELSAQFGLAADEDDEPAPRQRGGGFVAKRPPKPEGAATSPRGTASRNAARERQRDYDDDDDEDDARTSNKSSRGFVAKAPLKPDSGSRYTVRPSKPDRREDDRPRGKSIKTGPTKSGATKTRGSSIGKRPIGGKPRAR
jgi:hypothetical protein